MTDIAYIQSQASIIRRIADTGLTCAIVKNQPQFVDFFQHIHDEAERMERATNELDD